MEIPEVADAKRKLREVIDLLRGAGADAWAQRLESSLRAMRDRFATKEALHDVGTWCHPKALGDVVLPGIEPEAWRAHLDELHDLAARAFNLLERRPPE